MSQDSQLAVFMKMSADGNFQRLHDQNFIETKRQWTKANVLLNKTGGLAGTFQVNSSKDGFIILGK